MRAGWIVGMGETVIVLGLLLAVPAGAGSLTLDDALARARAASPSMLSAAADVEAARGRLAQARLLAANPVLSGDLAHHSAPDAKQMDRAVELAQEVEVGGQRGLRIAAARHDLAHAERAFADRWRTAGAEVRRAFAGLGAAERRWVLATESASLATRLVEATRRRARAGDVGEIDVVLAEIEAARTAQAVTLADTDRARGAARLAAAIGADPAETISVATAETVPEAAGEEELVAHALAGRPDLAAAREEQARLQAEADLVRRRGQVPNVTFRGFYREELDNEHIAGGGLSVPLPLWNREQGAESALRAAASSAGAEVRRLERDIPRQVHLALARYAAAAATSARYEHETLPAAERAGKLIERAYGSGYLGLPDVLAQRDRVLQARAAAIGVWLDVREAEADVLEAVGGEGE